jgi:carbon storage regulator
MLVLSRKAGQRIVIGGNITLLVQQIRGDKVRLAIEAPPEVLVLRKELVDRPPPDPPAQACG